MANERITLEKIDVLRGRAGISYHRAFELLEATDGDVVRALIRLEEEPRGWTERVTVSGGEVVSRVREILREGNVNRITIKRREKVLLDMPVTVGAVGAVLMPYLAALGVIAALATRCTIEVERRQRHAGEGPYAGYAGLATEETTTTTTTITAPGDPEAVPGANTAAAPGIARRGGRSAGKAGTASPTPGNGGLGVPDVPPRSPHDPAL